MTKAMASYIDDTKDNVKTYYLSACSKWNYQILLMQDVHSAQVESILKCGKTLQSNPFLNQTKQVSYARTSINNKLTCKLLKGYGRQQNDQSLAER